MGSVKLIAGSAAAYPGSVARTTRLPTVAIANQTTNPITTLRTILTAWNGPLNHRTRFLTYP